MWRPSLAAQLALAGLGTVLMVMIALQLGHMPWWLFSGYMALASVLSYVFNGKGRRNRDRRS
jgi:hypothetical protein